MSTIVSQLIPNRMNGRTLVLIVAAVVVLGGALAISLSATGPAPAEPAVVLSETATTPSAGAADSCHVPDAIVVAEGVSANALCNPPASSTAPAAGSDTTAHDPAFPDTRLR